MLVLSSSLHLLQEVHQAREGLLQDPEDLPALLQTEGRDGALRRCSSLWDSRTAGLLYGRLHDSVTAYEEDSSSD